MSFRNSKVVIVGVGNVGATTAFSIINQGLCEEVVLIDVNKDKAYAEALDMQHSVFFMNRNIKVTAGDYADCKDADVVIITASAPMPKDSHSRLEMLTPSMNIMKSIVTEVMKSGFAGIFLVISNPVDIMTYVFTKISGLPENQIIGSGTLLDTARLRFGLSEHFEVAQKNIHAYVFGEHGDTSFVPWSRAFVAGATLDEFDKIVHEDQKDLQPLDREEVLEYVHTSGSTVIAKKGATFYAVAVSVCRLCSLLLAASDTIVSVSTMLHGEYGVEDVCLSTMASIGPEGVKRIVRVPLTEEETEKLHASANALKDVIAQIDL